MKEKMVLVTEDGLGVQEIVEELEKSFVLSCEHNNTTTEDLSYFRNYIFLLLAMVMKSQREVKELLKTK